MHPFMFNAIIASFQSRFFFSFCVMPVVLNYMWYQGFETHCGIQGKCLPIDTSSRAIEFCVLNCFLGARALVNE